MQNKRDGKKVFFLNPHSVMQEQLMEIVFQAEYEVYLLYDHVKAKKVIARFPHSILFLNIDEKVHSLSWETYIEELMDDPETHTVRIGVLSHNNDPNLAQHYLTDLSLPCGFVPLSSGLTESAKVLSQMLEANAARGTRKHVRVTVPENMNVTFNLKLGYSYLPGRVRDISAAGMAGYFDQTPIVSVGQKVQDMQLNLKGVNVRISGVIVDLRKTEEGIQCVVVFTPQHSTDVKHKIRSFVYRTLQAEMDRLISSL